MDSVGGPRHSDCTRVKSVLRHPTNNGFPNMRTSTTTITPLSVMMAYGFLGVAASAWAQDVSGKRSATLPRAAQSKAEAAATERAGGPNTLRPEEEKAIRAVGEAFTRAYNAGDAEKVAALYTEDAEFIDEYGGLFEGRLLIEDFYSEIFRERPGGTIAISMASLRFLGPDVAKEEGQTRRQREKRASYDQALHGSLRQTARSLALLQRSRRARARRHAS